MIKFFVLDRVSGVKDSILIKCLLSEEEFLHTGIFLKIPTKLFKNMVEFVSKPEEADYFIVPHNYFSIYKNKKYIKYIDNFSYYKNKKVIVFTYGDRFLDVKIKNSIVLRTSKYKNSLLKNEIIVPAFVEDLGAEHYSAPGVFNKTKKPVIGFAGWVSCSSLFQWIKYTIRFSVQFFLVKLNLLESCVYKGLHFRRKTISVLNNTASVDKIFYLRNNFSGHLKTIEDDPKKIREQFVSSIKDSDLALAIKGDGNYSLRFFEILSLGRIPLLIDTDTPLPLEEEIDYDAFTLRVDYRKIHKLPKIINEFWQNMTEEKFIEMQKKARQAFDYRLSAAAFYRYLFDNFDDIVNAHEGDIR
jgi:hypothetical protein